MTKSTTANALTDLGRRLAGRLILPGDADYDQARALFYGGMDRRPAAVARLGVELCQGDAHGEDDQSGPLGPGEGALEEEDGEERRRQDLELVADLANGRWV